MRNSGTGRQQWDVGPHVPVRAADAAPVELSPIEALTRAAPRPRRKRPAGDAAVAARRQGSPNRWQIAAMVVALPALLCCAVPLVTIGLLIGAHVLPPLGNGFTSPNPNHLVPVRESVTEGPPWVRSPDGFSWTAHRPPEPPAPPQGDSFLLGLVKASVWGDLLACAGLIAGGIVTLSCCRSGLLACAFGLGLVSAVLAACCLGGLLAVWPVITALACGLGLALSIAGAMAGEGEPC